jgi:hypothetical protein
MKFFAGFVTAIIVIVIAAALVLWTYNVSASVPDRAAEFEILHSIMQNSVRMHAETEEERETWNEEEKQHIFCAHT